MTNLPGTWGQGVPLKTERRNLCVGSGRMTNIQTLFVPLGEEAGENMGYPRDQIHV